MGKIATVNTSDKTLIIGTREAFKRQTSVGSDYTDVRIGILYTIVPAGNDDAACVAETISTITEKDSFHYGLKDSSDVSPSFSGSQFTGVRAGSTGSHFITSNTAGNGWFGNTSNFNCFYGLTSNGATTVAVTGNFNEPNTIVTYSATNVNMFWGLRFVVNNKGLSTQTISFYMARPTSVVSDVSDANLKTLMSTSTYSASTGGSTTMAWNAASAALPLLDCFYIHIPWTLNRMRISNYAAVKYS